MDSVPSQSYLVMTAAILREAGFNVLLTPEEFKIIGDSNLKRLNFLWSVIGQRLHFGVKLLPQLTRQIELLGFQKESLQGDSRVLDYLNP